MRLTEFAATDRRVLLLFLNVALAVTLGFFALDDELSLRAVIHGGYWAMLIITALFTWSLCKLGRSTPGKWQACLAAPRWPAALVAGCGGVLLAQEAYGFKILMDEVMLLGTSMSMHFEKAALVPMRGNDIKGAFVLLNGQLDKRPLFQPFLTSVLHDFTGYRPENVFILNTALTFLLLALAYHAGRRMGGAFAGALAVLLLTSLPLLAQNATGGGFEVLNLVMILGTFALGMRYAVKRDADSQDALILSAVLLAQTRYESILFLLPVVLLLLWTWWRNGRPVLSLTLAFSPLLLVPYALHNKIFSVRTSSWELAGQPGHDHPFSLSYIGDNIAHALRFFFNINGEQSNSLVIAVLGFVAVPFFALWCVQTLRAHRSTDPVRVTTALFALGFAAHTLLLLCYFWGKFDDPVIRRLSLPLNLALVLAVVVVAAEFRRRGVWRMLTVLTVGGIFAHALPSMARHDFTLSNYIAREAEWRREFIASHPERDYLVIDNSSIFWITHLVSATPMLQALTHKENVVFHYRNHTFSEVYVFQRFEVNADTGALTVQPDDDLGPDYQLATVWERRFTPLRLSRISRVTSIQEGPAPPRSPPPAIEKLSPEQQDNIRKAYFERFIQKLP